VDLKSLVRDASKVHETLVEQGDSLVTLKGCKIYAPVLYEEKGLLTISSEINLPAIYMITVDDKYYGVSLAIANMRIEPTTINTVVIDESQYYEFTFAPGAVVCPDLELPKDDALAYYIYDMLIAGGKIPAYFNYEDLGKLWIEAEYHVGIKLGANIAVMPMVVATMSRDAKDRTKYYRHVIQSLKEIYTNPPAFIPFSDVTYNATNTVSKFTGSYFDLGVNSALVNPSQRLEKLETILRR
jgi:hypothetical protein